MADYSRKPQIFLKRGMNITLPGDRLSNEWFQYTQNVRSYLLGEWRQRPGLSSIVVAPDNGAIYYISRVNNNLDGTFRRFVGTVNGNVYVDDSAHTSLSLADSGFSGKKYSSIISRPDRSPLPFLFLGSNTRNSKFSTVGVRTEWGLAAPTTPATVDTQGLSYALVDNCNATTGFTAGGVGGAIAATSRVNTTVTAILYDSGSTGMASIVPASAANINAGMLLTITNATPANEETIVDDVYPVISTTTVAAISYDTGSTGLCTIQLTAPSTGLIRNSIVRLNSAEYVRVISVTEGLDGIPSFRCSTVATISATQAVAGAPSFRCSLDLTHTTASTIVSTFIQFTPTTSGLSTLSKTAALNLAVANISEGGLGTNRPIQSDDFLHIGIRGRFQFVTEIQVKFDVDASTNDFTRNYFFIALRQPDLQGVISQTQPAISAQQTQIQREQIDAFVRSQLAARGLELNQQQLLTLGDLSRDFLDSLNISLGQGFTIGEDNAPVSLPGDSGDQQWTELFLPISSFQRVGTDATRGWGQVAAFQITFQTTSSIILGVDDIWVGGTHGPDTNNLPGYTYVYRARNTSTGSRSNPSPPIRSPITSRRRLVKVTMPAYSDSQADALDVYRIGGTLQDFHYLGTVTPATSLIFNDDMPDAAAMRNPILEFDRFKPWPKSDLPRSGTCNTIGTRIIRLGGDTFNTAWVRGSQIIINGKVYTLYSNPSSTDSIYLNESAGSQTNVTWQMPDPILDSQALPAIFGPYAGAGGEFLFAVGDTSNPGFLYWTNGNDPESSSDVNYLELCSPSEKLMNGVVLDGIIYCFSDKRSWRILPSFSGGQSGAGSDFYPQETAMGKGLCSRWGLAIGDAIYFVSFDGIYKSRGDALEDITSDSLAPLFKRDGANTNFTAPVSPISFTTTDEDEITLTYSFDGLYFTYKGLDGNNYTFYFSFLTRGWTLDTTGVSFINRSSREIRSADSDSVLVGFGNGRLLKRDNTVFTDNGTAISCRIWDREEIWDDLRSTKQVGDVMIDANPSSSIITPTLRYENNSSNDILSTITGNSRDQFIKDINSGSGRIVRGAALDLTWSNGTSDIPKLYAWEPSALIKAEESSNRATDWDSGGYPGTKWVQGFRLKGDTVGLDKSFQMEIDGGTFVETFTFNANGEQVKTFWLTNPVVAHEMRIKGSDEDLWRNMGIEWIYEPEPELASVWETQVTSFDLPFFHHMREVMIAHRSTTDITMIVTTDGVSNSYLIPNGSGSRIRTYLPVKAIKAKYHKFRFTSSSPFGLWMRDIECRVGAWGRVDNYTIQRPFGDISRTNGGARV